MIFWFYRLIFFLHLAAKKANCLSVSNQGTERLKSSNRDKAIWMFCPRAQPPQQADSDKRTSRVRICSHNAQPWQLHLSSKMKTLLRVLPGAQDELQRAEQCTAWRQCSPGGNWGCTGCSCSSHLPPCHQDNPGRPSRGHCRHQPWTTPGFPTRQDEDWK